MKKEDAEAILGKGDLGPIDIYIEILAQPDECSDYALGICTLRIEEAAPAFRAMIVKATGDETLSDEEWTLFFRGLHVLGAARDQASFQPLLCLLRQPGDVLDDLLGDAITTSLAKIVAGVFDGDVDTLLIAITDVAIDDFVRGALFGAATFLTWNGRIERSLMQSFLQRFDQERLVPDDDHTWYHWQEAIALLGLREFEPLVVAAFEDRRVSDIILRPSDFEDDLSAAERAPHDASRFERANLGYIEDIAEALSELDTQNEAFDADASNPWAPTDLPLREPLTNPFRNVGRNDPCPCGSGKKAKKCCLATVSE